MAIDSDRRSVPDPAINRQPDLINAPHQPARLQSNPWGEALTWQDYRSLENRWIDRHTADGALIRRVPDHIGRDLMAQRSRNCAGQMIPYFWPGESNMPTCRIRRDQPEMENGKPKDKYLSAYGDRNRAYIVPGTDPILLSDTKTPIIVTEGEYKAVALSRLALHETGVPAFLPIGFAGVWNWRGTIGTTEDSKGTRVPEKGVIPDISRIDWAGRRVIIAFDADSKRKGMVRAARAQLSQELRVRGAEVGFLEWDEARGKGIDDWLHKDGPEIVLAAIAAVDFNRTTGWKAKLKRTPPNDKGTGEKIKQLIINADIALRRCPEWEGVVGQNEFSQKVQIIGQSPIGGKWPRDLSDADVTKISIWMQENGIELGPTAVGPVVHSVALDNQFHPLRDWLQSIDWDGTRRVDTWLTEYLGVAPSEYVAAVGRMWLISAVARLMQPGCQVDHVLILEGKQGLRKSTALRVLAGDEYFTDQIPDLDSKDAQMQTMGVWIMEFAELEGMRKHEAETLKAFITRRTERLRPPYGHHTIDVPRQCVFAGSTNGSEYLRDETGNRRFWPVKCTTVRIEDLMRDREQLWAEAAALHREGVKWYPEGAQFYIEAEFEQDSRLATDAWLEPIRLYVERVELDWRGEKKLTAEAVLTSLGIEIPKQGVVEKKRVANCLRTLGWEPKVWRDEDGIRRGYKACK